MKLIHNLVAVIVICQSFVELEVSTTLNHLRTNEFQQNRNYRKYVCKKRNKAEKIQQRPQNENETSEIILEVLQEYFDSESAVIILP